LLEWEDQDKRPEGEVLQILDKENENDIAMKEILLQYGFPLGFPDEALEEAARIPEYHYREGDQKQKRFSGYSHIYN
jgi:ribonuclease R